FDYHYVNDLSVSIPSSAGGACSTSGSSCAADASIKATVSGGKPPYTYHWIANRPPSVLLLPNAYERTVDVRCNVGESDGNKTSTRAWCRVKDSTGYEVSSNPCTVTFTRYYVT